MCRKRCTQLSYILLSWYPVVPRNTPEKKNEKNNLSPVAIYLILSWVGAGVLGKILCLKMLFPSPNPKPKKYSKPPLDKEDWTPSMCYTHWQEPAERVQKYLFLPQGQGGETLTPFDKTHFPSYTHLFSNQSLKCVGQLASRISNIKLCHIVFQITLFTVLSFQKKNVKDTVIQHNSSFSFLLSIS